jgi:signal transduction histidine kinase/AmiR/NasT family two-component response regulator/HPt (histidine-containing phosphotransfer) domain-containing protein
VQQSRVVGKGRIKLEAKRSNGEVFPIEFAIQSADTEEGEIFISFLRDISHRVAQERELIDARDRALAGEKAKTDFLATMSHEIRTPLNGLLGNLTLLNDTRLSPAQARYIKNMETSGKLLMSHISDVLDITKFDAGKLTLRLSAMNISTLVQDIVDNQSGSAAAHDTTLEWGWSGEHIDWIYADKERIQHILMNVIGNAVKFTRGGKVSIEAKIVRDSKATPEIVIAVHDTGVGISDDLKYQIFDDFVTGDVSYDREVGGTGLGFGIAQRFVKALGGTIEVESQHGIGSSFMVRFPIKPTHALQLQSHDGAEAKVAQPSHILLVEDNEINRFVAREMLVSGGNTVTEAHNGREAVKLAQKQKFDLILMDISMPIMDGRVATRAIRTTQGLSSQTPIIALTANAMAEEQEAFRSDGMNDILTKPLSREGLVDVLAHYIVPVPHKTTITVENRHLKELQDTLGPEILKPLLERFHNEVEETLDYLKHSADHTASDVAKHAHKIAGSAATMGAMELRNGLMAVENAAKKGDAQAISRATKALPDIWKTTQSSLQIN